MKANELRIGNWISTIYGMEFQVYPMAFKQMPTDEKHNLILDTWKPIPLTEEWLIKFGFEKSKVSSQFDKEKLTIQVSNELERHKKGRVYFNSWAILEESIKYVHQLQNLYFALTGEELTFKSE